MYTLRPRRVRFALTARLQRTDPASLPRLLWVRRGDCVLAVRLLRVRCVFTEC